MQETDLWGNRDGVIWSAVPPLFPNPLSRAFLRRKGSIFEGAASSQVDVIKMQKTERPWRERFSSSMTDPSRNHEKSDCFWN
ncbi:MAG: hypothetical protein CL917_09745 [Deltaproteobacteria bacterium]|nr:hypothetical protein [Deltaproteobacteria bacterium]